MKSDENPEECGKQDEEALRGQGPEDTKPGEQGVDGGLKNHLEMHLHQKTGAIAEKYDGSNEAKAQGKASGEKSGATNTDGKPADDKTEEKPTEGKSQESHDDNSKAQEKL